MADFNRRFFEERNNEKPKTDKGLVDRLEKLGVKITDVMGSVAMQVAKLVYFGTVGVPLGYAAGYAINSQSDNHYIAMGAGLLISRLVGWRLERMEMENLNDPLYLSITTKNR